MKKIILSISIILTVIIGSIITVFSISNKETQLIIEQSDLGKNINIGSYSVKNYTKYYTDKRRINFIVESPRDFYNDFIKQHEGYKSDLDFDIDGYFAYGFLIINDEVIKYEIYNDKLVYLSEIISSYTIEKKYINDYYSGLESYDSLYIMAPLSAYLSYGRINGDNLYETSFDDEHITFQMLINICSYLPENTYKIENNTIYLKGYTYYYNIYSAYVDKIISVKGDSKIFTDIYLIKIIYEDGKVVIKNADC